MNKPIDPFTVEQLRVLDSLSADKPVVMLDWPRFGEQPACSDPKQACVHHSTAALEGSRLTPTAPFPA